MSTLVVGDVHGCADELAALVRLVDPERVVLVGDLYTKGPAPAAIWDLVREGGWDAVLGNHDARLLDPARLARDAEARAVGAAVGEAALAHLQRLPLWLEVGDWTVVHAGLHPSGDLARTTRKMFINLRRFPDEAPTDPFWWQVYEGDRRVLYGHDAVRGHVVVRREGRPWTVGLDTGCVYGGALSGWILEEERLVQVKAARVYRAVGP